MVKQSEIPKHLIETALSLAAERGWRDLSLAEIAESAQVPLIKAYQVYPSKQAILQAFSRRVDAEVLANPKVRTLDGQLAKIHIGDRVPLRSSTIQDATGQTCACGTTHGGP